jgi:dTDP-4-dehydrorhamnose reductase
VTAAILVTGGTGQLARALAEANDQVVLVGRPEFDFDRPDSILETLHRTAPRLVINAAAWTAVDAAEAEPAAAARANAEGPAVLARHCREIGAGLIHISTDYVFDGLKGSPYTEQDVPCPTGVYGRTKLAGEQAVMAAHPQAIILRTSWVYARRGRNFVLTMLNAARRADRLRVVADQFGCPTNVDDLAAATLAVCDRLMSLSGREHRMGGLYHAAGAGHTSWHGFAEAIFAEAGRHGWPTPTVDAISTADWPTPARRPPDSRLDCSRLAAIFGVRLPPWQPSLQAAVAAICRAPSQAGIPVG